MKLFANAPEIVAEHVRQVGLPEELIPLLHQLTHKRRGWVTREVHEDNTIEDALQHTAKLALAAASINSSNWQVDQTTLRRELLVHELPEIPPGIDWMPGEISLEEKMRLERQQLQNVLPPDLPDRQKIIQLWEDYEKGGLAYFLDKADAVITAEYYALTNPKYLPVADEFYRYGLTKITDPTLQDIITQIRQKSRQPQNHLTPSTIFPAYFGLLGSY